MTSKSYIGSQDLSEDAALIVVDMQEDFCEPHGALAVKGGRELSQGINSLLSLPFKLKIATQDHHPADHCSFASQHPGASAFTSTHTITNPEAAGSDVETQTTTLWPDHCVQGTRGTELIPELDAVSFSYIVKKGEDKRVESYSAFGPPFRRPVVGMSSLEQRLKDAGVKRVFVCGLAFDFCVKATAIDAAEAGFETSLIEDLSRPVNPDDVDEVRLELSERQISLIKQAEFALPAQG